MKKKRSEKVCKKFRWSTPGPASALYAHARPPSILRTRGALFSGVARGAEGQAPPGAKVGGAKMSKTFKFFLLIFNF